MVKETIFKLNRGMRALSLCNQAMLRAEDEQTLLEKICHIIYEEAGYALAWVGYAQNDHEKTIKPIAWAGKDSGYIEHARLSWSEESKRGQGPAGISIRSKNTFVVQDITTSESMAPWRESAIQHGYQSGIALPLKFPDGEVFGVLLLYHGEPNAITSDELQLMEGLAGDISYGVNALRVRAAKRRSDDILGARLRLIEHSYSCSLDDFLTATLDEIEALTGSSIGFYHFLLPDQKHISLQAWSTNTTQTMCSAEGKGSHYEISKAGVWTDCIKEYRPIIHNDYASLPHRKGMPEGHAPVIREMVVPIIRDQLIVAIIGVGNKVDDYTDYDIEFLSQLADFSWDIVERKMAENERLKSNAVLDSIVENIPNMIFLKDAQDLRFVRFNKAGEELLGHSREELLGKCDYDLFPEDQADFFTKTDRSVLEGLKPVDIPEEALLTRDWGERFLHTKKVPILNNSGEAEYLLGISEDVTERKWALAELQKKQELLLESQRIAHIGNWWHDLVTGEIYWSDEFFNILGQERQEITAEFSLSLMHPDDRHVLLSAMEESAAGKEENENEFRIIRPDGEIRWIHNRWIRIGDENGKEIKRVGTHQDITERKQMEEALQATKDMLNAIIEAAPTAIIGLDLDGRVHSVWNPAAEKMLGWSAAEAMGQVLPSVPKDSTEEFRAFREKIRSGMTLDGIEVRRQKRDGSPIDYSIYASPLRDAENRIAGNVAVLVDITERKRVQEALQDAYNYIQQLISSANVMIVGLDASGHVKLFNQAAQAITGYTVTELTHKNWFETIVPRDRYPDVWEAFQRYQDGTRTMPRTFENPIMTKSGEERIISWQNSTITTSDALISTISFGIDVTERRRAEAALRLQEHEYRTLVENIPDLIVRYNSDLHRIYVNPAWEKASGLSARETVDVSPDEIPKVPQPVIPEYLAKLHQTLETGAVQTIEFTWVNARGAKLHLDYKLVPEYDNGGNVVNVLALGRDVTEQRQAQTALEEQYSTLRGIINGAQALIFSVDRQYRYTSFNQEHATVMKNIYGASIETGCSILDYMTVLEDRDNAKRNIDRALAGEQLIEESYSGDDFRSRQYFQVSHSPIKSEDGQIIGVSVIAQDMTARKKAEEELQKREAELNESQRIAHIGSWDWDAVNDTIWWSDEYYRIYGFDPKQPTPNYTEHLKAYTPESGERLDELVRHIMETGEPYEVDLELAHPTPDTEWITARGEAKRDAGGKICGLRGTAQNITPRKRNEEEIHKLNLELEKRVIERTAQFEAANKELEAFVYSVSHDLRAPLRGIDGFSQILLEEYQNEIDAQGKNYLTRVRLASQRMAQLIDDLLNLSRISRTDVGQQEVNLSDIAREIADNLLENQPERQVAFEIQEGIIVRGDHRLLRIALENILENAWKFTSKHPLAHIEFGQQKGTKAVNFVRDDGAGFDSRYAQKLFGAFQRLHATNEFSGTGIGLATVKKIIDMHGGSLWAEGKVEEGATFYFTIP